MNPSDGSSSIAPERAEEKRVARMRACDSAVLIASIAVMWLALGFVLREVLPLAGSTRVKLILWISAAGAGVFATGALIAVVAHLRRNRETLYREDLANHTKREDQ